MGGHEKLFNVGGHALLSKYAILHSICFQWPIGTPLCKLHTAIHVWECAAVRESRAILLASNGSGFKY